MGCLLPTHDKWLEPEGVSIRFCHCYCSVLFGTVLCSWVYRREIGLLWIHNGKHHSVKFVAKRKGVEQERGEGHMGAIEIDGVQAPRLAGESLHLALRHCAVTVQSLCSQLCSQLCSHCASHCAVTVPVTSVQSLCSHCCSLTVQSLCSH